MGLYLNFSTTGPAHRASGCPGLVPTAEYLPSPTFGSPVVRWAAGYMSMLCSAVTSLLRLPLLRNMRMTTMSGQKTFSMLGRKCRQFHFTFPPMCCRTTLRSLRTCTTGPRAPGLATSHWQEERTLERSGTTAPTSRNMLLWSSPTLLATPASVESARIGLVTLDLLLRSWRNKDIDYNWKYN